MEGAHVCAPACVHGGRQPRRRSAATPRPAPPFHQKLPASACPARLPCPALQPRLSVVLVGTNDLTNCGWSITDAKKKEAAVDKQLPGIVGR